jgi:carbamoyl-phosphate synthase small subunit
VKAILALKDGTVLEGTSIGAPGTTTGQVVFNTSMTGYQEMLTDPSYGGQILTFTYPLIGNYGVTAEDFESRQVQVRGAVLKELAPVPSNWRSENTLEHFLKAHNVIALAGVDTRALTRHLRMIGVMMGGISTEMTAAELIEHIHDAPDYGAIDYVRHVSTEKPFVWRPDEPRRAPHTGPVPAETQACRVAVLDLGVKHNILRRLTDLGCEPHVFPATAKAEELLEIDPAGILVSPGPGDPERLGYALETVKALVGKKPLFGICLGHQLLGDAFGGGTFPLKFGHRGGNHPVKDLQTGAVTITSQNHGYAVDPKGLEGSGMEVARINLNDGTVEGLRHTELPIFSIQYHPEASPGPWDSDPLFQEFVDRLER